MLKGGYDKFLYTLPGKGNYAEKETGIPGNAGIVKVMDGWLAVETGNQKV